MIGVKPLFSGRSLGEGENATFDVIVAAPDGASLARSGLRYELLKIETRYQWYRRDGYWDFEPIKTTRRVADGTIQCGCRHAGAHLDAGAVGPLSPRSVEQRSQRPVTSVGFDAGFYAEASADTPDMLEIALDKPEYAAGDTMTVAVTARTAGKVTLNVIGDRLITTATPGRAGRHRTLTRSGRQRLGHRRLCGGDAAPSARYARRAHARPRHRRAVVRGRPQARTLAVEHDAAAAAAPELDAAHAGEDRRACRRRGGAHRRCRGRCRHPQPHQLQAAGAGRLLPRPAPAHRRPPRSLRPAHRRHAGHARPDQVGRRHRGGRAARQPADAEAARALFRHRHGPCRRHRRGRRSTSRTSPAPRA